MVWSYDNKKGLYRKITIENITIWEGKGREEI